MKYIFFLLLLFSFPAFSKTILFLGDSLTEGYQLSAEEAYPFLVEKELKKTHKDIKVINGGVSGSTSASASKRLDWYLKAKPEIIVLALGANDGLRGLDLKVTEKNLEGVVEKAKANGIKVILAGMKIPTNMGEPYRKAYESMYPRIAKKYSLPLIPYLLEGVGGKHELNLPDGIHPNPEGHEIMAKNVLKVLEKEL